MKNLRILLFLSLVLLATPVHPQSRQLTQDGLPAPQAGRGHPTAAGTRHTVTLGLSGGYYFLNKKKFDAGTVADISLYIGTTF